MIDDPEATKGIGSDYRFDEIWNLYPRRNGVRQGKKEALAFWCRMTYADKSACFRATRVYAESGETHPPDMVRWLRHERWRDWQDRQPPTPRPTMGFAPERGTLTRTEYLMRNKTFADMTDEEVRAIWPTLNDVERFRCETDRSRRG